MILRDVISGYGKPYSISDVVLEKCLIRINSELNILLARENGKGITFLFKKNETFSFYIPFDIKRINEIQNLIFLFSTYSKDLYENDLNFIFKELYSISLIKYARDRKINKILNEPIQ